MYSSARGCSYWSCMTERTIVNGPSCILHVPSNRPRNYLTTALLRESAVVFGISIRHEKSVTKTDERRLLFANPNLSGRRDTGLLLWQTIGIHSVDIKPFDNLTYDMKCHTMTFVLWISLVFRRIIEQENRPQQPLPASLALFQM